MIDDYCSDKQNDSKKNTEFISRIRALEEENKKYLAQNQKLQKALEKGNENEKNKDYQFNNEIENLKKKLGSNIADLNEINQKHK